MTNAEKANALAKDYLLEQDRANITYEEMLEACLDMAEWKDQQFKKYLEKKLAGINGRIYFSSGRITYEYDKLAAESTIREIIKELFE